ncbi:hypothetical protein LZ31DRAFT_151600 [Colletotrichum somersetense]|nr:hypothetical protein LZ31DRAFT_151600 [Colletotrichum somersetense]
MHILYSRLHLPRPSPETQTWHIPLQWTCKRCSVGTFWGETWISAAPNASFLQSWGCWICPDKDDDLALLILDRHAQLVLWTLRARALNNGMPRGLGTPLLFRQRSLANGSVRNSDRKARKETQHTKMRPEASGCLGILRLPWMPSLLLLLSFARRLLGLNVFVVASFAKVLPSSYEWHRHVFPRGVVGKTGPN